MVVDDATCGDELMAVFIDSVGPSLVLARVPVLWQLRLLSRHLLHCVPTHK